MDYVNVVSSVLQKVREKHPLVHNITNFVVMNSSANILLAQGAFPVMAHSGDEVAEMVSLANSLVLNIGTLEREWVEAMICAGKRANELGKPVVLDPVGSGATKYRTETAKRIINDVKISVLRGNASEVFSIVSEKAKTRGVDSILGPDEIADAVKELAVEVGLIIGVSGKEDLITDGHKTVRVANGVPMMTLVTGLGCGLSATVGAFIGAHSENPFEATYSAFAYFGIAGEIAAKKSQAPGSFAVEFLDALYNISPENLNGVKIREG